MRLGDVCTRTVTTVAADAGLVEAARKMRQFHVGDVVVVDPSSIPVGIVTDRDLVVGALALGLEALPGIRVGDLIQRSPIIAREDADITDAIAQMRDYGIRRMPIVDSRGRLSGIVSYEDLVEIIAEELRELAAVLTRERQVERAHRTGPGPRPRDEWR